MVQQQQHAPRSIYTLADHLDTLLAACEDILEIPAQSEPGHLIRLELVAITHVLQARRLLEGLRFDDDALSDSAVLFLAGTAVFDPERFRSLPPDFANAGRKGMNSGDAASPVSADYLIGHQVPIATLSELATHLLDMLEYSYVLWDNEQMGEMPLSPTPGSPVDLPTTSNAI